MVSSRISDLVGRVLGGRYRLTRPLGTGASAHVYVAEDVTLRRRVAIKVLHPGLAGDEAFLRRFRAEARAVAALRHPHILRVYDWGEDDGSPFLVSELLEGGSLRSLLDRGHLLTPSQATALGFAAAAALDHAHRRGLVHRDIKPANLLFDEEGRVSVADFGLARALAEATWTEPAGAVIGTARYAAPEQVQGKVLDDRADVYSLALVLTEATTGVVPFATDTTFGTLMARIDQPLVVPDGAGPVAEVLEAAGNPWPAERPSAADFAHAFERLARSLPPPAPLPLTGPLVTGLAEHDDDPTHIPRGRAAGHQSGEGAPALSPAMGAGRSPAGHAESAPSVLAEPGPAFPPLSDLPPPPPAAGAPASDRAAARRDPARDAAAGASWSAVAPVAEPAPAASAFAEDPTVVALPASRLGEDPTGVAPATTVALRAPLPVIPEVVAGAPSASGRRRWPMVAAIALVVAVVAGLAIGAAIATRKPPLVAVPPLRGDDRAAAVRALATRHLGLVVAGRAYDASVRAGTVASQTPATGRIREHHTVAVVLSLGPRPVKIPSLVDESEAGARRLLAAAGLKVGAVSKHTSITVPAGDVISASPSKGMLLPGRPVALVVSSGKPSVVVPLLQGASIASYGAAASVLQAYHLVPVEQLIWNNVVPAGEVVITSPGPNATVLYGASVTVDVSKGPDYVDIPSNLVGMSVAAATAELQTDGFSVSGVTGNPVGQVLASNPPPGSRVIAGSSIQLYAA